MKNLLSIFAMALIVLFSVGCNKDDDDDGGGGGNGGDDGYFEMTLNWELAGTDIDLSLIGPDGSVASAGFTLNQEITVSEDDQDGPGEEFIRFDQDAPDGQYFISVSAITFDVEIPFELTIESNNDERTFNNSVIDDGTGNNDDDVFVVIVTKSGDNLTF